MSKCVISSDGKKYPSITFAACAVSATSEEIRSAIRATCAGEFRTVNGVQWAYADDKLRDWPEESKKSKEPRSVVCSAGHEFPNQTVAARLMWVDEVLIREAALATKRGEGREVVGVQWAYKDEIPEVWPEVLSHTWTKIRSVVNSAGREFSSPVEAARAMEVNAGAIRAAAQATKYGAKCEIVGVLWAYKDEAPEVWPRNEKTQPRPVVCSAGREFSSPAEAARAMKVNEGVICAAAQATKYGVKWQINGVLWAYKDEAPEVWLRNEKTQPRSVVCSTGQEFSSLAAAACVMQVSVGMIYEAVQATKRGMMCRVAGVQWAYKDEAPEVWLAKVSDEKVESCDHALPINPSVFNGAKWKSIPGFPHEEVSLDGQVRLIGTSKLLPLVTYGSVTLVRVRGHFYSVIDLMMLAFVGPKPYGHSVQRHQEARARDESLFSLFYGP